MKRFFLAALAIAGFSLAAAAWPVAAEEKAPAAGGAVKCPVPEPKEIPPGVKKVFGTEASVDEKVKVLFELGRTDRVDDCVDTLRWLTHQNSTAEKVRDEAIATLVRWEVFGIENDLLGMLKDPAQAGPWRARCVFHLAVIFNSTTNKEALRGVENAMTSEDTYARDEATAAGAWLARSWSWDHTAKERYERVVALVEKQLAEPRKEAVLKALQGVSLLALGKLAPVVEKLVADEKQPEDLRLEAARTLAAVARPESIAAIDAAAKAAQGPLAAALREARGFALAAQLEAADVVTRTRAFDELAKLGMDARPALERFLALEAASDATNFTKTLLSNALLEGNKLTPIDRTGFKRLNEEEGKPESGNKNVLLDTAKKLIVIEGEMLLERGALEYAVVCKGENAKLHESIVGLACPPLDVIYALLACNYTYAGELKDNGKINLPKDAGVMMSVEFEREIVTPTAKETRKVRVPLDLLIWNAKGNHTMRRVPWAFTGSRFQKMPDGSQVLMASVEKSIVAIMADPNAVLNTPLDSAADADVNPQAGAFYVVNPMLAPKKGSKCSLVFEPWTGDKLTAEDVSDGSKKKPDDTGKDAPKQE